MKNWKTTVFGLLAGIAQIAAAAAQAGAAGSSWKTSDWIMVGSGLLTSALGVAAKDAGVTGTAK